MPQVLSCVFPPTEYSSRPLFVKSFDSSLWQQHYHRSRLLPRRNHIITQTGSRKLIFSVATITRPPLLNPPYLSVAASFVPRASMESDGNGIVDRSGLIDPSIAEVIIVRHGETEWNALGKLQGHLDVDLNEAGRDQAAAVAERLSRQSDIAVIYSSDLRRAFETAQTIAAKCGGVQVIADQDLRERNLGDLQGHQPQELMKLKPEAYLAFMSQRMDQEIPGGGESIDQLYQRCTSALQRIGKKHKGERVVVVTHGGVIRSLYRRSASKGRTGKILNTSVGIIHLSDDGDTWTIKSWNDISHLKETRFLKSGFGGDSSSG